MPQSIQGEVTVDVCLRSSAPSVARGRQDAVRERVEALADRGTIADSSVEYWSTRVCVPGGTTDAGPADRCPRVVGEILAAVEDSDATIEPYFRTRPASYDADEEIMFLPVICLLVRERGDLVGGYPSTVDGERLTVEDGLDRLAAGRDPTTL
jgi:hypothetical protein